MRALLGCLFLPRVGIFATSLSVVRRGLAFDIPVPVPAPVPVQRSNINNNNMAPPAAPTSTPTSTPAAARVDKKPNPSFYQRKLPETCIPFASKEGKQIFASALATNGLKSFYSLIQQL
jgi:hypothetical protein